MLINLIQRTKADQTCSLYTRFEDTLRRQSSVARMGGISQALVGSFIRNSILSGRKSDKIQSLDLVCSLASELYAQRINIYTLNQEGGVIIEKIYEPQSTKTTTTSTEVHLLLQAGGSELCLMIPIQSQDTSDPSVITDWTLIRVADRMKKPLVDVSKDMARRMGFRYFLHAYSPVALENYCLGYLIPISGTPDGPHEIHLDLTGVSADTRFLIEGCQVSLYLSHIISSSHVPPLFKGEQSSMSHLCYSDSQREPQTGRACQLLASRLREP
jgi:hypothetical protein